MELLLSIISTVIGGLILALILSNEFKTYFFNLTFISIILEKIGLNTDKDNHKNKPNKNKLHSSNFSENKISAFSDIFVNHGITFLKGKTNRPICPECYNRKKIVYLTQTTTEKDKIDQVDLSNAYRSLQNSLGLLNGKILALSCTECDYKKELGVAQTLESVVKDAQEL